MRRAFVHVTAAMVLITQTGLAQTVRTRVDTYSKEDSRLKASISIQSDEIYVGDLLARTSKQTGVTLDCGHADGSADVRIAVYCRDYPLAELMQALYVLLSHRDAEVMWERNGSPGAYSYELRFPLNARQLASRLRQEAKSQFEGAVSTMARLAAMDPSERGKHASEISRAYLQTNDAISDGLLKDNPPTRRCWDGLRLFSRALTPSQQRAVVFEGASITLKASDLPASGADFLTTQWHEVASSALVEGANGTLQRVQPPTSLMFRAVRDGDFLTQTLVIDLEGMGGYGYVGGSPLNGAYERKVKDLWSLPGDALEPPDGLTIDPAKGMPLSDMDSDGTKPIPDASPIRSSSTPLERRLREFADTASVGVLARIGSAFNQDPSSAGSSVGGFLERVKNQLHGLNLKWSNRTLVIEEPPWFWTAENIPPWSSVKWFRETMVARKGALTLNDLCELSRRFSDQGMTSARRECPSFDAIAPYLPLLRLCAENPEYQNAMTSERGLQIDSRVAAVLHSSAQLSGYLNRPGLRGLCFDVKHYEGTKPSSLKDQDFMIYRFGYVTELGEKRYEYGFRMATQLPKD